jgi:hypothetical protein
MTFPLRRNVEASWQRTFALPSGGRSDATRVYQLDFQIFQTPQKVGILYEYVHAVREVYLNLAHLERPIEWWMGDSRGKWDGDTLVVDVVHFIDQTWFDRAGNHHSDPRRSSRRVHQTGHSID